MNKRVLITGGGRGIGAATARYLAAQGYHLCLNYRQDRASAEAVVAEILATHPVECIAVQADVSVEAEVVRLFEEMGARLGPVTHLVNNAGRLQPQMRVLEMSAERINQTLTTNVTSCFLCCREAVRRMTAGGAIVNVSSAAARLGSPGEYVDYAAAKGAVDVLTRGLSLELAAQGIRVNGVRPGFIYTDMHADGGEPGRVDRIKGAIPLQRGGEPREVAAAIAWLPLGCVWNDLERGHLVRAGDDTFDPPPGNPPAAQSLCPRYQSAGAVELAGHDATCPCGDTGQPGRP